jgi:peptide/nickel transport system permease protein
LTAFIVRRLLYSIPVLLGVIFVVFTLSRVIPGDPCRAALGERATDAVCDAYEVRYGLDKAIIPFVFKERGSFSVNLDPSTIVDNQFIAYLGQISRGDLGRSLKFGIPVTELLVARLPVTIELTLVALLFAVVVGMTLGLLAAYRRNSKLDVGTMVVANVGVSIPVFVLGLTLAYIFAIIFKDTFIALPPSGRLSSGVRVTPLVETFGLEHLTGGARTIIDFFSNMYLFNALITGQWHALADALRHLILPMIALGTIPLAIIARMTRSSLLDVLGLDYIRTARAKGLGQRLVVFRHGMRNALLPIVTVIGLSLGGLLSGAVLTETIFGLSGVGLTFFEAITGRDYVVIQGFTLIIAVLFLVINLVVDVSYAWLDPRIRLGR